MGAWDAGSNRAKRAHVNLHSVSPTYWNHPIGLRDQCAYRVSHGVPVPFSRLGYTEQVRRQLVGCLRAKLSGPCGLRVTEIIGEQVGDIIAAGLLALLLGSNQHALTRNAFVPGGQLRRGLAVC
jgi:hypothetical protein